MSDLILISARLINGVLAGIYVAFLVAFMPALHRQPDDVFALIMNRVNVVIVNPVFMIFFLGGPLLTLILLGWLRNPLVIVAAALAVAAIVITFAANIPLNNRLARGAPVAAFETPWLIWHTLRTLVAVGAFVLLNLTGRTH